MPKTITMNEIEERVAQSLREKYGIEPKWFGSGLKARARENVREWVSRQMERK